MSTITRVYRTHIPVSPEALMAWHASPGAFDRLTPTWRRVEVLDQQGTIEPGDRKTLRIPLAGPAGIDWMLEHEALDGALGFADVQVAGPFRSWRHEHRFLPAVDGSVLEDRVTWELPRGAALVAGRIERELDRLFAFRHDRTYTDLVRLANSGTGQSLRVAITGASGLVGQRLSAFLRAGGHEVFRLTRGQDDAEDAIHWNPAAGEIDAAKLEGMDAVVHLAGASIAGGLWTEKRKAAIRDSRIDGTRLLATTLAKLHHPPSVFVSTSAVGYYGSRGDEMLDEDSVSGDGFLAEVVRDWERAARPAASAGIRVVHPRLGVVLAGEGGMLPLIALPFRVGAGGPLGDGGQYFSWIAIDDLIGVLHESITNPVIEGPINAVAPQEVTNAEFTETLASVLNRPSFMRVPAWAMKRAAGQLAEEVILASQRVAPARLDAVGFQFAWPTLEHALRHELGRYDGSSIASRITSGAARARAA